ncbi:hypothetical protein Tco_0595518 [Tanacetum coccineum]
MITKRNLRDKGKSSTTTTIGLTTTINTVMMITTDSRIEDKKPSRFILPPTDILETVLYVKDAPYINSPCTVQVLDFATETLCEIGAQKQTTRAIGKTPQGLMNNDSLRSEERSRSVVGP